MRRAETVGDDGRKPVAANLCLAMNKPNSCRSGWLALTVWLAAAGGLVAQTYRPANWVNDPFCLNPNFGLVSTNTSSPVFTNNAVQRGTLYAYSPIGASLQLVNPGDSLTCTGQVILTGDINADGDMQFRIGLFYRGTNTTDTNWLGYLFGNPAGGGGGAATGLFVRNNPNPGVFASGSPVNALRPDVLLRNYNAGWAAGTYNFSLSITLLEASVQQISWSLTGVGGSPYSYAGSYRNTNYNTAPMSFDQIGMLAGAALFNSASPANTIQFTNVAVIFNPQNDVH